MCIWPKHLLALKHQHCASRNTISNVVMTLGRVSDRVFTAAADATLKTDELHDQAIIVWHGDAPGIEQRQQVVTYRAQ